MWINVNPFFGNKQKHNLQKQKEKEKITVDVEVEN